jgi:hypothetical protein
MPRLFKIGDMVTFAIHTDENYKDEWQYGYVIKVDKCPETDPKKIAYRQLVTVKWLDGFDRDFIDEYYEYQLRVISKAQS